MLFLYIGVFMHIETKVCKYCRAEFSYVRKRKPRKFCSQKCTSSFHNDIGRDQEAMREKVAQYYKDYPAKRFYSATKASAKKRNLPFDLTEQWFEDRLNRGRCELTGFPVKSKPYRKNDQGRRGFYSPSIDRIDNSIGYVASNCRLICWGLNMVKSSFTDRDLNALSLSLMLNNLPRSSHQALLVMLPQNLIASLPSGHPFPVFDRY
jgi:hypothetical protein